MASTNVLGIQDAYALLNGLYGQAIGGSLVATDAASFVAVGEAILQQGLENTLNAMSYMMAKTIFAARPYRSRLASLERTPERFGLITRKITYLMDAAEETESYNTQIDGSRLADGQSIDMYKIKAPKAVQLSFPGAQSVQNHITRFVNQLRVALSSPEEFIAFWDGAMLEFFNNMESEKEARSRVVLLNRIAGQVAMGLNTVDLVYEFNAAHGTSYSRADLLSTYAVDFWKFVAARIQTDSNNMLDRSALYHANLTGVDPIPRHTPKDRQRMIMFAPAFTDAKTNVWSTLFNPEYLNIGDFETVNFWQSKDPGSEPAINFTPNILNTTTGEANVPGAPVEIPYCLGMLYDEEALGVMPKYDFAGATPLNVAGQYYNLYYFWLFKMYSDYTENAIVYVLGDLPTDDGPRLAMVGSVSSLNISPTPFNKNTFSYTAAPAAGTLILYFGPEVGCSIKSITVGGNEIGNYTSYTFTAGAETNIVCTVSKPGYADVSYTFAVSVPSAKDGGDEKAPDDPAEDPAEEPVTKSTRSTKSTK